MKKIIARTKQCSNSFAMWLENHPLLQWVVVLGLTWLFFVAVNGIFCIWPFGHLNTFRAGSVSDYLRWTQAGRASSRPLSQSKVDREQRTYDFLNRMFVTNIPATDFLERNKDRLVNRTISEQYQLLANTLNVTKINEKSLRELQSKDKLTQHLEMIIKVAWIKHVIPESVRGEYIPKFNDLMRKLSELDPQDAHSAAVYTERFDEVRKAYQERLEVVKDRLLDSPSDKEFYKFHAELDRIVPSHKNNHLFDFPIKDDPSNGKPTLTILYFPSGSIDKRPNNEKPNGKAQDDEKPHEKRYAFALEISQEGDFTKGWTLQGRYLLFDLERPRYPLFSPQHPSIKIVTREWGWLGFRPAAVWTTEEQLAARFFSELETLAKGAGEDTPLKPGTTKEVEQHQRYIHRVLLERLGRGGDQAWGRGVDEGKPESSFNFSIDPMSDWIVWVRRLNGGSWWGWIQFVVITLVCAFAIEIFQIYSMYNRVAKLLDKLAEQLTPLAELLRTAAAQPQTSDLVPTNFPVLVDESNSVDNDVKHDLKSLGDSNYPVKSISPLRLLLKGSLVTNSDLPAKIKNGLHSLGSSNDIENSISLLRLILENRLSLIRFIAGVLPLIGFLGSVAGLSNSLIGSSGVSSPDVIMRQSALQEMQIALGTAFDKSMLAFAGSIICLFGLSVMTKRLDNFETQIRLLFETAPSFYRITKRSKQTKNRSVRANQPNSDGKNIDSSPKNTQKRKPDTK
jgi:hypothetical protein